LLEQPMSPERIRSVTGLGWPA
jgi:hypothetical protein